MQNRIKYNKMSYFRAKKERELLYFFVQQFSFLLSTYI